jgi:DNA helicase-4
VAGHPHYISDRIFQGLTATAQHTIKLFPLRFFDFLRGREVYRKLRTVRKFLSDPAGNCQRANAVFVRNELIRSHEFFDIIEARPLSDEQRQAIVVDEDNNLLIAAAGSGKTSVIVGKAGWLILKGYRRPSEMLLLAFAKDAQLEMKERVKNRLGDEIAAELSVSTFHGLGMSIISEVEGRRPSLAKFADDRRAFTDLLTEMVNELSRDPYYVSLLITWFSSHFAPHKSVTEFGNLGEYYDYLRTHEIRSLKGEKVKSYEECEIANFLYLNGISYAYERRYEHETATVEKRQYQPDFYLIDHGVYIEHFALNEAGDTPPFINKQEYLQSMEWKRRLHAEHGTPLIETFSYEKASGKLTANLAQKLESLGIQLSPISTEKVFEVLEQQGRVSPFINLNATFLNHFKGSMLSIDEVEARSVKQSDATRARAFLQIFARIYELYQKHLSDDGLIDFNDMIAKATKYVEHGHYKSCYHYVLVDEFQDISLGRARLLKALLSSVKNGKLFAVGDDWQAIFRFAGSDITVMRQFEMIFGPTERLEISTTFRCNDQIANLTARFVLKNPAQIVKSVSATHVAADPCVHLYFGKDENSNVLRDILDTISGECAEEEGRATVKVLGRYRHLKPEDMSALSHQYPNLELGFSTVHASKGLEADYVIVLSLRSGKFGFPSEIEDDPVLNMVLAEPEGYSNAEERRLFYVAMTRAKRRVFLISSGSQPSSFVKELANGTFNVTLDGSYSITDVACPKCVEGRLKLRKLDYGVFFGCSNWPYCEHIQAACPYCNAGIPVRIDDEWSCQSCGLALQGCRRPGCDGWLQNKEGKHGNFLGCSNWPKCNYTSSGIHDNAVSRR